MKCLTIEVDDDMADVIGQIAKAERMSSEQTAAYLLDRTLFGQTRRMTIPADQYVPQSVMVMVDENDNILKPYRCENCGNIVFNYCGSTRLIMNGRYDRDMNMIDGEEVEQEPEAFGVPTLIGCNGRVLLEQPNGRLVKKRCGYKYYKLRA